MLSARKKERAKIFSEFYEFNENLLLNLKYEKIKLKELAKRFPSVLRALDGQEVLSGDDGAFLRDYTQNIGKTDPKSQIDYLNGRREQLERLRNESAEEYKRYSSLYVKICLLAGILVAVLLA